MYLWYYVFVVFCAYFDVKASNQSNMKWDALYVKIRFIPCELCFNKFSMEYHLKSICRRFSKFLLACFSCCEGVNNFLFVTILTDLSS